MFYNASYFLTEVELGVVTRSMERLGQNYQRLGVLMEGEMAWQARPKLHYAVAHLPRQAGLVNPRFVQTYGSEGMVGVIGNVYKSSQNGPYAAGIETTVMAKYRTGLVLSWR